MRGIVASKHLRMTLDQLLEYVLGVVGRLAHGDVRLAVSQVDAGHGHSLPAAGSRVPPSGVGCPIAALTDRPAPRAARSRLSRRLLPHRSCLGHEQERQRQLVWASAWRQIGRSRASQDERWFSRADHRSAQSADAALPAGGWLSHKAGSSGGLSSEPASTLAATPRLRNRRS